MQTTQKEKETQNAVSSMRFMQMVFGAAGGAILFGIVNTASDPLMEMASTAISTAIAKSSGGFAISMLFSSQVLLPVLGLAGIAAVGLGCVYLGAKYMTSLTSLEQETQAQKIAKAKKEAQSVSVDIQPTRIEKTNFIPGVTTGDKASEAEASNDNQRLVAAGSPMNQAASRIDASSALRSGMLDQASALQRA
jgi:hypothetical protein